ncbi:hypothetical protein [Flexithrix dorotheae]|uniref:hypothetical protein n=1 Tax=Flexithrix dorotheae TaxID=70993 RepID=UPI001B7F83CE|nr:hypothetical protein [Flexithrix dorotheae]
MRLIGGQFSKATSAFIQIPDLFKRINIYLVFILGLTPFSLWIRRIFLEKRLDEISILIISLLFTGIILFFAARLLPFKLYMPLRYLEKTFPIAVTLVVLYLFNHLRSIKFFYAISYSFFGILLIGAIYNNNYRGFNDYSEYKFVFSELEKTDKKSLIIAPPLTADMIPFFSKRSVLVSKESCHGVYYQYYREDQMQKMSDLIKLYAAPDLNDIIKITARHQVDYIVLDKNFIPFSDLNEEMEIFSPFNNKLENLYAQKMIDKSFFINLPEAKLPIFAKNDRFLIVECEKFKTIQNIFSGDQKSTVEVNY